MEPKIKFGDIIFVHKTTKIQPGNIVLFKYNNRLHIALYKLDKNEQVGIFSPINKQKNEIINNKNAHVIGKIMCWRSL